MVSSAPQGPSRIRPAELLERYDGFLIDAYGVLVDARGALPGAAAFLAEIGRLGKAHLIVTNDASRTAATNAARLRGFGMEVDAEHILGSGDLLAPHFARQGLAGARCLVLGTDDSRQLVAEAGGRVCPIDRTGEYDAVVICDDAGFPFLEGVNAALSALIRAFDAGRPVHMICPNPDLIFPAGQGTYGFTSGAMALLLESALARRYPDRPPLFDRLGKPHAPLFDEAKRRLGKGNLVMIGDQLETDIAGALAFGIDAALLTTGVSRWSDGAAAAPTYLLDGLV